MAFTKTKKCGWLTCACFLIILSVQVTFLPQLIRNTVSNGIVDDLVITSKSSSGYKSWANNTGSDSVPVWMECRFFNVTNVYEVIHEGKYPNLSITPPMVYNEITVKYNISFSEDKEWAQYNTWEYYTYNEDRTYLDPKAEITIISPLLGLMYYSEIWRTDGLPWEVYDAIRYLEDYLGHINISDILFWRGTAEDLLFNIYHANIPININNPPILPTNWYNITIPFGLLNNGTQPGSDTANETFEITNTGNSDHSRIGELKYYGKFGEFVECWSPAYPLSPGHDTYFGINTVKKGDTIPAFVSTLALNVKADWNYSYTWKGIELYRYTVQVSPQFDTADMYPPNAQFFQYMYSGIENLTSCSGGLPLFVSMPYFLGGDDRLIGNLSLLGLPQPSWETDLPYIDIEPRTGAIFRANKSLQINTMIHSIPWIENDTIYSPAYERLPDDIVIPMVELSECESLTDSQAKTFKSEVVDTHKWAKALEYVGYVSIGLLIVFALISTFVYGKYYAGKHDFNDMIDKKLLFQDVQQKINS